jgi:hypothetical protein
MGQPHPGRCTVDWPNAPWRAGGLGHGTARTIHETRAMTMPPAITRDAGLDRACEALAEEGKDAEREFGAGVTVGRCAEAQARQMGPMTAGGVAMENWAQEELCGGDWGEQAVAPGGIPNLPADGQHGFGLQQQGPLPGEAS